LEISAYGVQYDLVYRLLLGHTERKVALPVHRLRSAHRAKEKSLGANSLRRFVSKLSFAILISPLCCCIIRIGTEAAESNRIAPNDSGV
jgi:hypothetical protein